MYFYSHAHLPPPWQPLSVFFLISLFSYFLFIWLRRALAAAHGIFIVVHGFLSSCGARVPVCTGLVLATHGLSCPTACEILVFPPGIKPASPAFEGGFLSTGPPGKSHYLFLIYIIFAISRILYKWNHIVCNFWDWLFSLNIIPWRFI